MKICYVAAFEHSFATEAHAARDAEALGVTVDRVIETRNADPRFLAELEERATGADLLIYQKTHGLPAAATDLWARLEAGGTATASYHLDLYIGLRRGRQAFDDPFWRTGTVFTADGDPATTARLAELGINHRWLPAAVVSDETELGQQQERYDHDVVFVGSQRYHPEWPWRTELLDYLKARYGARFAIYDHHPPTRGQDLNDLYATARVVVGDSLALPGHERYWSDRYYETIGRGGFLVAPHVPGIDEHFTDWEHLRYYDVGDTASVGALVDHYLDHPKQARAIASRGREHVAAHHTYRNRVAQMLAELGLTVPA